MAGPLTHLPQIAVWACLLAMGNSGDVALRSFWVLYVTDNFWVDMCRGAIGLNIGLFLFNLLIPAYPLDGGRILVAVLLMLKVEVPKVALVCIVVNVVIATLMIVYGLFYGLGGLTICLIAIWVLYQAYVLHQHRANGTLERHPLFHYPDSPSSAAGGGVTSNPLATAGRV